MPEEIVIDAKSLLERSHVQIRRAAAFLGFGVNAALDKNFRRYQLAEHSNLVLVDNDLPEERVDFLKSEFKIWIQGNGLRDLVDAHNLFLDGIYEVCELQRIVIEKCGLLSAAQANAALVPLVEAFHNQGLPNKINILKKNFNIETQHVDQLKSLNKARNCLVHRNGVVSQQDLNTHSSLTVSWLALETEIHEPNGALHLLDHRTKGIFVPDGGTVVSTIVKRAHTSTLGQRLTFEPYELAEICFFYFMESSQIHDKCIHRLNANIST